jgi:hypothetical protein
MRYNTNAIYIAYASQIPQVIILVSYHSSPGKSTSWQIA